MKTVQRIFTVVAASFALLMLVGLGAPLLATEGVQAQQFRWVNGHVDSFTFQLPNFNVVGIKGDSRTEFVRFCNPSTGADSDLTTTNVQYDLLKTAFLTGKSVQVGIHDFGKDPASGINKLCIDRVILR